MDVEIGDVAYFFPTQKSICVFYQKYKDVIKRPEQFLMFYKHGTAYSFYVGAFPGKYSWICTRKELFEKEDYKIITYNIKQRTE